VGGDHSRPRLEVLSASFQVHHSDTKLHGEDVRTSIPPLAVVIATAASRSAIVVCHCDV